MPLLTRSLETVCTSELGSLNIRFAPKNVWDPFVRSDQIFSPLLVLLIRSRSRANQPFRCELFCAHEVKNKCLVNGLHVTLYESFFSAMVVKQMYEESMRGFGCKQKWALSALPIQAHPTLSLYFHYILLVGVEISRRVHYLNIFFRLDLQFFRLDLSKCEFPVCLLTWFDDFLIIWAIFSD